MARRRLRPERVVAVVVAIGSLVGGVANLVQDRPLLAAVLMLITAVLTGWAFWREMRLAAVTPMPLPPAPTGLFTPQLEVAVPALVWNVPSPTATFAGRAEDLVALAKGLARPAGSVAVVAVHGLGGVGKTQLALQYAHAADERRSVGWLISATRREYVLDGLAGLGTALGLPKIDDAWQAARDALAELGRRDSWLLVYDDAAGIEVLDALLPVAGQGQVVITSRYGDWRGAVRPLRLAPLPETEAAQFLLARTGDTDRATASALAARLDGLPLALEQAAAYCTSTGIMLVDYMRRFDATPVPLLSQGQPAEHPDPVARTWLLSIAAAHRRDPAATELLCLLSLLAPAPLPRNTLTAARIALPTRLRRAVANEVRLDAAIRTLTDLSLLTVQPAGMQMHALVQQVVREHLASGARWTRTSRPFPRSLEPTLLAATIPLLWASFPAHRLPESFDQCLVMRPHVEAVLQHAYRVGVAQAWAGWLSVPLVILMINRGEFVAVNEVVKRARAECVRAVGENHPRSLGLTDNLGFAARLLGDLDAARAWHERAYQAMTRTLGPAHGLTLMAANNLAEVLRAQGEVATARVMHEQVLAVTRAAHAPNREPVTSMNNLALTLRDLGDLSAAADLLDQTLTECRKNHGREHPLTLTAANNLAEILRLQGQLPRARAMHQETAAARDRLLGPYHLDTLGSMNNLAMTQAHLGNITVARALLEQNLATCRRILAPDHPVTMTAMGNLVALLDRIGDPTAADTLRAEQAANPTRNPDAFYEHTCMTSVWATATDIDE